MLNLECLRTLHAVATHGSLNAAADVLNVSSSAVSQQLAKLEEESVSAIAERIGVNERRVRAILKNVGGLRSAALLDD
mgnify:CR=1 FL=1